LLSFASPFCHSAITILYVSLLIIQTPQYFPHNTPQKQFIFLFLIAQYLTTINYFYTLSVLKDIAAARRRRGSMLKTFVLQAAQKGLEARRARIEQRSVLKTYVSM